MKIAQTLVLFLLRLLYGYRVENARFLAEPGPVMLLPNHVSWLDWLFLWAVLPRDWLFVASRSRAANSFWLRLVMDNKRTFVIDPISPFALREVTRYLQGGGRLVIFPEGHITRSGSLRKLFDGVGFLASKSEAKILTAYLAGAVRLPFVRHSGWTRLFPRVSLHIAEPHRVPHAPPGLKASEARNRATTWIRDRMLAQQLDVDTRLGHNTVIEVIRDMADVAPGKHIIEDVQGARLTYRKVVLGANVLARKFASELPAEEGLVGVLLPNVAATPVTLMALWSLGKAPAILNFSAGMATMLACAQVASLRTVLTSRAFLEKANLDVTPLAEAGLRIVYLEDVRASIGLSTKLASLFASRGVKPLDLTRSRRARPDDTGVVLFTSGSEGMPKAVDLSHKGLVANLRQAVITVDFLFEDRFFSALPMFHSFGLVLGTLLPLINGSYVYLYPTPLHYRVIPAVVYDRNCTILLGTNTFLAGYARRCHPFDFQSVRRVFSGGEKVQDSTFDTWARKFGIRIFEGYGATEFSPLITTHNMVDPRPGSTGRFLPGMEYRLDPVEGVPEGGQLFIRGPQMMRGYLNPEANEKFKALGGWYDTGDIVKLDDDGFVYIVGRVKRFAKIGGEMVSLTAVEDALNQAFAHLVPRRDFAVISRRDKDKGEHIVAVTTHEALTLPEMWQALRERGLVGIALPRELRIVPHLPLLGTGKVDYRSLEALLADPQKLQA